MSLKYEPASVPQHISLNPKPAYSGVAACTYHFFYNSPDLAWLVALQANPRERFLY